MFPIAYSAQTRVAAFLLMSPGPRALHPSFSCDAPQLFGPSASRAHSGLSHTIPNVGVLTSQAL